MSLFRTHQLQNSFQMAASQTDYAATAPQEVDTQQGKLAELHA